MPREKAVDLSAERDKVGPGPALEADLRLEGDRIGVEEDQLRRRVEDWSGKEKRKKMNRKG